METTKERMFFEIYGQGGIFSDCLMYVAFCNNIDGWRDKVLKKGDYDPLTKWHKYDLPQQLEQYDTNQVETLIEPTFDEIRSNIESVESDKQKKMRYIYSLLTPFDYVARRVNKEEYFEAYQSAATNYSDKENPLKVFVVLLGLMWEYGNRLDALLLQFGIDFMQMQRDCGITLHKYRTITDIAPYIGTIELTQRYIDNLATPAQNENADTRLSAEEPQTTNDTGYKVQPFGIPDSLTTEKAEIMLKALEGCKGYSDTPVLDRSNTPWKVSSHPDWGYVAEQLTRRLELTEDGKIKWQMWANLIGVSRNTLRNAYRSSTSKGAPAGANAILSTLNKLK